MYAGIDSTLHLTETCENPRKVIPRALMTTVVVGLVTGFGFSVAMCYGITDLGSGEVWHARGTTNVGVARDDARLLRLD